jgi:hypothetical protein
MHRRSRWLLALVLAITLLAGGGAVAPRQVNASGTADLSITMFSKSRHLKPSP